MTLVAIRGGAARPLGAQMAVREDGLYCGFVSGGCVESAVAYEALEVMASGEDRTVMYGVGSPYFDIVLPCGGGITLTVHKLRTAQPLLEVLAQLEQRKPAVLRYSRLPGRWNVAVQIRKPAGRTMSFCAFSSLRSGDCLWTFRGSAGGGNCGQSGGI
ncbi:xanthine dehydrogenase accessory factor [Atlantibacter hermannii]|nr:xanthine dehydrogenase accessory factor [Atlantibacter hermannii]